jgi:putative protease
MNHLSAAFWYDNGVKRIVLAREASLEDITYISLHKPKELELEAFVHGAMCVAYSGRCLLSSIFTGRSGNRGECAQPCRWEYTIHEAGYKDEYLPVMEDGRGTYILNSKDLMMLEHIPEMVKAGITSFKIEGRMKSAYYVASVVNAYRRAIDSYMNGGSADTSELAEELLMSGSRKFTTGFFFGKDPEMQDIEKKLSDRSYSFCGLVIKKKNKDGKLLIEQRNRFFAGEKLHVLSPNLPFCSFKVEYIESEEGERQESAPHPQQHVYINCPFDLSPGDILRVERGKIDAG